MPENFPWDAVMNILFFVIGFGIGLFQLWQAQSHHLADQKSKYEEIRRSVGVIEQKLAVIEGVTNRLIDIDKTLSVLEASAGQAQDRLMTMVERQMLVRQQVGEAAAEASSQIVEEVVQSGMVKPEDLSELEGRIATVVNDLSTKVASLEGRQQTPVIEDVQQRKFSSHRPEAVLEIDRGNKLAKGTSGPIDLTPWEFVVLSHVADMPGAIVNVRELRRLVPQGDDEKVLTTTEITSRMRDLIIKLRQAGMDPLIELSGNRFGVWPDRITVLE